MALAFERATTLAAKQLARARSGFDDLDAMPTENDFLLAGHIIGNLLANNLLNTAGEKWTTIESAVWPNWRNRLRRFMFERFGY